MGLVGSQGREAILRRNTQALHSILSIAKKEKKSSHRKQSERWDGPPVEGRRTARKY
jgi:hypothetical protein